MLLAALVIWALVADELAASSAAAVAAAVSAAPCIVRLIKYQLATSVPSPAKPTIADRAIAMITAVAPARSPSRRAKHSRSRRGVERMLRMSFTPGWSSRRRARSRWRRPVTRFGRQDYGEVGPRDVQRHRIGRRHLAAASCPAGVGKDRRVDIGARLAGRVGGYSGVAGA